jgi:hypothetical protein
MSKWSNEIAEQEISDSIAEVGFLGERDLGDVAEDAVCDLQDDNYPCEFDPEWQGQWDDDPSPYDGTYSEE